jgi:hypothetical protein
MNEPFALITKITLCAIVASLALAKLTEKKEEKQI